MLCCVLNSRGSAAGTFLSSDRVSSASKHFLASSPQSICVFALLLPHCLLQRVTVASAQCIRLCHLYCESLFWAAVSVTPDATTSCSRLLTLCQALQSQAANFVSTFAVHPRICRVVLHCRLLQEVAAVHEHQEHNPQEVRRKVSGGLFMFRID